MGLTARIGTVLALTVITGCAAQQSRLNVFNIFGSSSEQRIDAARASQGGLVDQVVSLDVAQTRSGVIISAVGLPPTQGFWDAELLRVPSGDPSVLRLDFRLLPPISAEPQGTQPSREVLAGLVLSTQDLAGIRTVVVQGARNGLNVSRR